RCSLIYLENDWLDIPRSITMEGSGGHFRTEQPSLGRGRVALDLCLLVFAGMSIVTGVTGLVD
ncbi:MAG: hypothetical protein KY458_12370, partial [Actinobacteria bacterium]|nr:hypothetical protein [Actinomycetota bacterium]